jgi:hypothetical protein
MQLACIGATADPLILKIYRIRGDEGEEDKGRGQKRLSTVDGPLAPIGGCVVRIDEFSEGPNYRLLLLELGK